MKSRENTITAIISHTVLILVSLMVVIPFLLLVVASFTDNTWAAANGFTLFPGKWSLEAYQYIWVQGATIGHAYLMTIVVTLIGTGLSILITTLLAYATNQTQLPEMRVLNFLLIFSMLFNGGLVATFYSYVNYFHVRNTIWALILPNMLMSAFNVILVRNYFRASIPDSLLEAARLDGAGEFRIYGQIVFPLSKPIVATIGLMTAIAYWNDWQNGLYYLTERGGSQYYTIQVILNNINNNIQALNKNSSVLGSMNLSLPSTTIRMAIAVVGILPILAAYPFFQQYFVKGITMGGVKE